MLHGTTTETVRNGGIVIARDGQLVYQQLGCGHERHHGTCADCQRAAIRRQTLHLIASDEAARRWVAKHPLQTL